jgi:ATP-binding cassette, subfamily B (MDR/TAP), member 1
LTACLSVAYDEISMHPITLSYPTRPLPIHRDVPLYLPANETTFVIGKSTTAALFLQVYTPNSGRIDVDDQDAIDDSWVKENMAAIIQLSSVRRHRP